MDINLYDEAVSGRLKVGDIVYNKYRPNQNFTIAEIEPYPNMMGDGNIGYRIRDSVSNGFTLLKGDNEWKRFRQHGSDSNLFDSIQLGEVKVGDKIFKISNPNDPPLTVVEIELLINGFYRVTVRETNGETRNILVNKNRPNYSKFLQRGGKNRRKSRRNKKTKRRKSKRLR